MKLTKAKLKQIIKEELQVVLTNEEVEEMFGEEVRDKVENMQEISEDRGGYGPPTVKDIEGMLPASVIYNTPGASSLLQRRALEAKMSKNDLAAKIKDADPPIKDGEHPRDFFDRLGLEY